MANLPPKWVLTNEQSVWREVERYRKMTPSERAELLFAVCRDAETLARVGGREEFCHRWQDPLPESSVQLLARLREAYRAKQRGKVNSDD